MAALNLVYQNSRLGDSKSCLATKNLLLVANWATGICWSWRPLFHSDFSTYELELKTDHFPMQKGKKIPNIFANIPKIYLTF